MLGTPDVPYDPLVLSGAPLVALRRFDGLEVSITTRSSEILEQLDLLVELDQRHAVGVDMLIASIEPGSADLQERLRTVAVLSSQGITTRLVLTDLPGTEPGAATRLHRLFEAAVECGVFDVVVAPSPRHDEAEESTRLLRCLRLELSFPRSLPGRG